MSDKERAPDHLIDHAARGPQGASVVTLCHRDLAVGGVTDGARLQVVALEERLALSEMLACRGGLPSEGEHLGKAQVELFGPGPIVSAVVQELGRDLDRLVETAGHHERVDQVGGAGGLIGACSGAAGEGDPRLAVLFGAREVAGHQHVGEIRLRQQLNSGHAGAPRATAMAPS